MNVKKLIATAAMCVAAGATLSTMAESTAAAPQTRPQVAVEEVAARDVADIEQRMKAIRLPEVAFEQPKTIADAVKFFYEASKKYDRAEIPVEKRGFNMILQTGGAAAPEIPMLRLKEVSFYDALKFVCARVDYTFEINYASDLGDVIVTIKPRDNSKSSDAK